MAGLVDAEVSAAGQGDDRQSPPTFVLYLGARGAGPPNGCHKGIHVVRHEVKLLPVVLAGMHGHFRRWQPENEPAMPNIHMGEADDVPKKGPVRFRILAEDDGMCA